MATSSLLAKKSLRSASSRLSAKKTAAARRTSTNRRAASRSSSKSPGTRILVVAGSPAQRSRLARGVAVALSRDLLRLDLARVASKYAGETEKNLNALFAAAETKGGVLYFDEADALFGKRTNVRDAHDRYVNLEVSSLVERIESSSGVIVLATNSVRSISPAWMKRLRFALKLTEPKPARR